MRCLVLADVRQLHWRRRPRPVDVVLGCGDVDDAALLEAALLCDCRTILAIKGNRDPHGEFVYPIRNLHLQCVNVGGVRFGGFEGCWRYKPRGPHLYTQEEAADLLDTMPAVDVLITHNSPWSVHDAADGVHHGFVAFHDYIRQARPRVLIHGHQHANRVSLLEDTAVLGVAGWTVFQFLPAGMAAPRLSAATRPGTGNPMVTPPGLGGGLIGGPARRMHSPHCRLRRVHPPRLVSAAGHL